MREQLFDYKNMAADVGLSVRSLRWLVQQRKVPVVVLGHKLRRFRPSAVHQAIAKLELKAVTATRSPRDGSGKT